MGTRPRRRAPRAGLFTRSGHTSPAVVDLRSDEFIVDRGHLGPDLLAERSEAGGRGVGLGLGGVAGARDDHRDAGLVEDPPQRELRHRHALGHQRAQPLHGGQTGLVVDAGEGLADVEGLAVAVEVPVVVFGEPGLGRVPARQEARGQGHARDDADPRLLGGGQHRFERLLPERVEDDLDAGHVRPLDRRQRLLARLDADSVGPHPPFGDHRVEVVEDRLGVVDRRGRAVQLHQIQRVDAEVRPRVVVPGAEVLGAVVLEGLLHAPPHLGGHGDARVAPQQGAHEPLGPAVPVDVGGVEEVHAGRDRRLQRRVRVLLGHLAPGGADLPGAEADHSDRDGALAGSVVFRGGADYELALFHAPEHSQWARRGRRFAGPRPRSGSGKAAPRRPARRRALPSPPPSTNPFTKYPERRTLPS